MACSLPPIKGALSLKPIVAENSGKILEEGLIVKKLTKYLQRCRLSLPCEERPPLILAKALVGEYARDIVKRGEEFTPLKSYSFYYFPDMAELFVDIHAKDGRAFSVRFFLPS